MVTIGVMALVTVLGHWAYDMAYDYRSDIVRECSSIMAKE